MKTAIDRTTVARAASPAMAQLLRLSAKAGLGHVVFSSLGCGRDRVVELLLESLSDDRPSLLFGQSLWPPSERPTKFRADITSNVKTKGDLLSRLAQATPQATLVAASDCGLSLFDLVEASVRSGSQLIYLAWLPQGDAVERAPREIASQAPASRSQAEALYEALPKALPLWIGIKHAPDGSFCVRTIAESRLIGVPSDEGGVQSDVALDTLMGFREQGLTETRAIEGQFFQTGAIPWFIGRLAEAAESTPDALAAELFRAGHSEPGLSGSLLHSNGSDPSRARRFRAPDRPLDVTKRA